MELIDLRSLIQAMYQNNPFAHANPVAPYTPPQRRMPNDPFAAFDDLAQQPTPERSSTVTSAQRRQQEQRERVFSDIDPFATFQGAPAASKQAPLPQAPPASSAGFHHPGAGAMQPAPPPPPPQAAVQAEPAYFAGADPATQSMGQVGRAVVMDAFAATSPAKPRGGSAAESADPFASDPFGGSDFAGGAAAQSVPPPTAGDATAEPFATVTQARASPRRGQPSPAARTLHMAFGGDDATAAAPAPSVAESATDPDAFFGFGSDPNNARGAAPPQPSAPAPGREPAPPVAQAAASSSSDLFDFFSPTRPAQASPSVPVAAPAPTSAAVVPSPTSKAGPAPAQATPTRPGLARQRSARQELLDTAVSLRDDGQMSYASFQALKRRILIGDADARAALRAAQGGDLNSLHILLVALEDGDGPAAAATASAGGARGQGATVEPRLSAPKTPYFTFDNTVAGDALVRWKSKMVFQKWKPVFFALFPHELCIYEHRRDWVNRQAPMASYPIHPYMTLTHPSTHHDTAPSGLTVWMIRVAEDSGDRRTRSDWRPDAATPQRQVVKIGFTDNKASERFLADLQNAINVQQDRKRDQTQRPTSYFDSRR